MKIDPRCDLLSRVLIDVVAQLQVGAAPDNAWAEAKRAFEAAREKDDVELFVAIEERDLDALKRIVWDWQSGKRQLVEHDRDVLKRALKAFRQRLKIVRLDSESTMGHGPMSSGRESSIVGVRPPDQYPQEVWDELVRQKRLIAGRDGVYELPPE
ncbi:MAG TPA: hypothetical protein VFY93_05560 [Planctomycetota bacterium]|nr:hypothetical protein [Planctomycetota bacterium]